MCVKKFNARNQWSVWGDGGFNARESAVSSDETERASSSG